MEHYDKYPKYDIRRVRELTEQELIRELCVTILPYCWTVGGNAKPHDADLELIAGVIARDLLDEMNDYRGMFVEEIKRALWDGAKGKWGEFYGMNIKSLEGFIAKYSGSDFQTKFRKAVSEEARKWGPKQIEGGEHKLTENEKDALAYGWIKQMVKDVSAGKQVSELFPAYTHKHLSLALGENNKEIPKAYVRYARKLGLNNDAAYLDQMFRKMGLYTAI